MDTRPCTSCGVQIHPASRRCVLCGATQTRGRWPVWAVLLTGLFVPAAVVAVVVSVSGGGGKSGGSGFRLQRSSGLAVLVPVGWTRRPQAAPPPGTARVVFEDPRQPHFVLSLTATRPARGTAHARARNIRALATGRLGFVEHFFGRILFPGGRPAWLSAYESDGFSHVTYVETACQPGVAVTVEVSAPDRAQLGGLAEPIAASSAPQCSSSTGG